MHIHLVLKLLLDRIVITPAVREQLFEATFRAATCLHQFLP